MFVIHVEDFKELKLFAHTIIKDSNVSSFLLDIFSFLTHHQLKRLLNIFLIGLRFYIPVNSDGHVKTVSSPNHTFFLDKLDKGLTSTSCTYFHL